MYSLKINTCRQSSIFLFLSAILHTTFNIYQILPHECRSHVIYNNIRLYSHIMLISSVTLRSNGGTGEITQPFMSPDTGRFHKPIAVYAVREFKGYGYGV